MTLDRNKLRERAIDSDRNNFRERAKHYDRNKRVERTFSTASAGNHLTGLKNDRRWPPNYEDTMNARELDIHTLISAHGPLTSAQLQDYLTQPRYGYNLEVEQISKIASKMKSNGLLVGEDRPNPGTKPVRYWSLPKPVAEESLATEMDSDIAEIEQGEWSDAKTFECEPEQAPEIPEPDYEPSSVAFRKVPMTVDRAICALGEAGFSHDDMPAFMSGIAAAERHHGIAG